MTSEVLVLHRDGMQCKYVLVESIDNMLNQLRLQFQDASLIVIPMDTIREVHIRESPVTGVSQ